MIPSDMPENYYFGGGGDTFITPLALGVLLLACMLILLLPRRYVVIPFLFAGLLMTVRQQIVVAGFHFAIYRLLILIGWIRILCDTCSTRRNPFPRINSLDKAILLWALCNAIMYTILWRVVGAFVNRLGFLYATIGCYFLLRYFIRDHEDVIRTIKVFSVVLLPIAIVMCVEHLTGWNPLSVLGGVPEYSSVRNGLVRAQGPFLHAITAGTFGAMLLPLFVALWRDGKENYLVAGLGIFSSGAITISSASSTPVMTLLAGIVGLCFWPLRKNMRVLRWGLVLALVMLHVSMKAPAWFLINRVSAVIGGTGWHRAELIDQFIRRFGEWWLVGTQTNATWGVDMWDAINAYVNAGVEGGLITFILFLSVFFYAYKRIGFTRKLAEKVHKDESLIWALGAALFGNTVAFFGITYFDQSAIAWYALLAMISAAPAILATQRLARSQFTFASTPARQMEVAIRRPRSTAELFHAYASRRRTFNFNLSRRGN